MGDFFANLGHTIENAAKDVERALNGDIKPWFKQAGRDIDHACNHDVIPWFEQAGRDIEASVAHDILPWLEQAGKEVEKSFTNDIVPWFEQAGKDVEKFAANATQELGKLAVGIDLDHLPEHTHLAPPMHLPKRALAHPEEGKKKKKAKKINQQEVRTTGIGLMPH
ncbi:hypothetical protein IWZ01DRAFT_93126 [Phyllosticta capitalensis]